MLESANEGSLGPPKRGISKPTVDVVTQFSSNTNMNYFWDCGLWSETYL